MCVCAGGGEEGSGRGGEGGGEGGGDQSVLKCTPIPFWGHVPLT